MNHGTHITNEAIRQPKPSIEIIYAGGTISSLATPEGHRAGGHSLDLLAKLEERSSQFKPAFEVGNKEVAYTGLSENMDPDHWRAIDEKVADALTRDPKSIVITHGTDSMEQTARHLSGLFLEQIKTAGTKIILTGANEDLEHPATDAWDNLQFALESAAGQAEAGVYVAFHGRLVAADDVVKLPFVTGGEAGFVSKHDPLYAELRDRQQVQSDHLVQRLVDTYSLRRDRRHIMSYDVNVIRTNHEELLDYVQQHQPKAVLLTLYHSGTANTEKPDQSVAELVCKLRADSGIVFFGVTENGEAVDLHSYETSVMLREAGVVPLYNMLREVALVKLGLVVTEDMPPDRIIHDMLTNQIGEIDPTVIISEDVDQLLSLYA